MVICFFQVLKILKIPDPDGIFVLINGAVLKVSIFARNVILNLFQDLIVTLL